MSAGLKNKIYIKKLICELWKKNAQRSIDRYPQDFFRVMQQYWPLSLYMLKKFGWKSWYSFWYTKLFVVDEGGEYDFMHRVYSKFPVLLKKPFKLEIEHTTVCNKKCIFCAHTHFGEKQFQMSFGNFKFIVDSTPNIKWVNM